MDENKEMNVEVSKKEKFVRFVQDHKKPIVGTAIATAVVAAGVVVWKVGALQVLAEAAASAGEAGGEIAVEAIEAVA